MPRRKAAKAGSGPTTKKSKTELSVSSSQKEIDGIEVRCEWEGDNGTWTIFAEELNREITERYNGGDTQMEFTSAAQVKMIVKFDKMVQKNKKSGWEKRIRFCVKDASDKEFYIWQCEDEHKRWQSYNVAASMALEKAYRLGENSVDIIACHQSYSIDIKQMEQTNTVTNAVRLVSRSKSDGVQEMPELDNTKDGKTGGATEKEAEKIDKQNLGGVNTRKSGRQCRSSQKKVKTEKDGGGNNEETGKKTDSIITEVVGKKSGKRTQSGRKRVKKEAVGDSMEGETVEEKTVTLVVKGKAPVDSECLQLKDKAHVYCEMNTVWDCMLNQTNTVNNNNKFYIIQLLEEDEKRSFYVWQRWGRVGYKGQSNLVPCGSDLDKAMNLFMKKFFDKTKNDWTDRHNFKKIHGKYDLLQMDYSNKDIDETDEGSIKREPSNKVPESKLDVRLQQLITLISDVKSMEETVMEMKYDAKKAPLGRLTAEQIKAGYAALKKIDNCIQSGDFGSNLVRACDEFYTRIPHEFGMRQPPLIRTKQTVKEKIQLLEALGDIQIAIKMLKMGDTSENPIDRHYHSLKCRLETLDQKGKSFKLIEEYLYNTHASTHSHYTMQVLEIFECTKENEAETFKDYGNKMLLWHGSRLTNWVGILSKGLRIAPPEAPVTGYMFGKGVYFADMSSKSTNYCFATRARNVGLVLLCEVSLGECNDLLDANYNADQLPEGKHSVRGLGKVAPNPKQTIHLSNGTMVPLGNGIPTDIVNPKGYTLNYNEYIVYNTEQIKMKYLVKIKFNFK